MQEKLGTWSDPLDGTWSDPLDGTWSTPWTGPISLRDLAAAEQVETTEHDPGLCASWNGLA